MRKIRRKYVNRIGGAICLLLIILYTLHHYNPLDEITNQDKITIIERSIRSPLNQGECKIPWLPVDNPEVMKFYRPSEKLDCGDNSEDWVMCEKAICFVKPQIIARHGEVVCSYTDLIRKSDYKNKYGATKKTKDIYVLQASDFVKASCSAENGKSWSGMAYGIRDSVDYTVPAQIVQTNLLAPQLADNAQTQITYFNVLIFGFDSMSQNAVIRKLPRTYEYLTSKLGAIVLKGYNIVGDGTPQALVPLLTGYTELELPETRQRMRGAKHVDVYPMIWKEYKRHGYVTSFNEDVPSIGTFTYRMTGFEKQPVDHYLRTFYLEAQNFYNKKYCIGNQPDHVVMLDYTKNFMAKYKDAARFVFSFHGGLSHDGINEIGAADDDVLDWLRVLNKKKLLENTILVFMADHGNRFSKVRETLQGKQEERLPFFSFAFPESFKKRYPQQYSNFVQNSERLTTPFDVHATLQHILRLQKEELANDGLGDDDAAVDADSNLDEDMSNITPISVSKMASSRSISLLDTIPKNRSCADAYIEPHWCACLNWQTVQIDDETNEGLLIRLSYSILNTINAAVKNYRSICAHLTIEKINWAMRLLPKKELLNFKQSSDRDGYLADMSDKTDIYNDVYQLQIVVNPGKSLFEASVTYDLRTKNVTTKLSEISRINEYGNQANCIYDINPELRKYCYCKSQNDRPQNV